MMTHDQLAEWLQTDTATVVELIAQGLPSSDGQFDPEKVAAWLESQGLAERRPTGIVDTLVAVARAFSVSREVVRQGWRPAGMPVEADGTYDLAKIDAWKRSRPRDPSNRGNDADERTGIRKDLEAQLASLKAQINKLHNDRRAGLLADRDGILLAANEAVIAMRDRLESLSEMEFIVEFRDEHRAKLCHQLDAVIRKILTGLATTMRKGVPNDDDH